MNGPDFRQMARDLTWTSDYSDSPIGAIEEQLRQVWNARGKADAEAIDVEAHRVHAEATRTGRIDLVVDLVKALREVDR